MFKNFVVYIKVWNIDYAYDSHFFSSWSFRDYNVKFQMKYFSKDSNIKKVFYWKYAQFLSAC